MRSFTFTFICSATRCITRVCARPKIQVLIRRMVIVQDHRYLGSLQWTPALGVLWRWWCRVVEKTLSLSRGQKHLGEKTARRRTASDVLLVQKLFQFDACQLYLGQFEQHPAELVDDDAVFGHREAQQTAVIQQRRTDFTAESLYHAGVRQPRNVWSTLQHSTVQS